MVVKFNKKWCGVATVLVTLSAPVAVDGQEPSQAIQRESNTTTQAIQPGSSTAVIEALPVVLPVQGNPTTSTYPSRDAISREAISPEAIVIQQPTMSYQAVAPIQGAASELPQPHGEFCSECDARLSDSVARQMERLAVDAGRRCILARYPHAGYAPIRTLEIKVRGEGDVIHLYSKLVWYKDKKQKHPYEADVFVSMVYTRGLRRVFDLSYEDNFEIPYRNCDVESNLLAQYNKEFERRDPTFLLHPLVGQRLDLLEPRRHKWIWNPFARDIGWHVSIADDYAKGERR